MGRKKKKIHYLYKTTCKVTNRYYIGMHSTNNLEDNYLGSGRRLRASIRKHGEENHEKEILEFFESRDLLVEAEIKAITPDMIGDKDCMNLMGGGTGGFISEEHQKYRSQCANKKLNEKLRTDLEFKKSFCESISNGLKKAMNEGRMLTWSDTYDRTGMKHTDETKKKMSDSSKGKGEGETNSQYGTCWITKGGENKKIKKESFPQYESDGWLRGRKLK